MFHVTSVVEKMDAKLDQIASGGKFTLGNFGVIVACLMAVLGSGAAYVSMVVNPISEKAASSEKDRDLIHSSIGANTDRIASAEVRDQKFEAALTEVETQFRASDQVRNLQDANQWRIISLIFEKSFKQKFPSDIQYYPNISQKGQ